MVRKICVLGAGIIGLYSAVRTLEDLQNVDVTVIAEKFSPNNTTDVAAGFWHPYRMGSTNPSLIKRWSDETFKYLLNLHESPMASELGIQLVSGYYLNSRETNPFWKDTVFNLRDLTPEENKLFPNYTNNKFFTSLIVCGTLYMQWLMERFISLGGKVKSKRLESLSEVMADFDVVVNCCGLGNYQLNNDRQMTPIRGQVIRVNAPWIKHFYIVSGLSKPVFIFPSKNYVVMGGTDQEGNWDTTPNEEDQRHILDSCAQVVPSLKNVEILETRVGLRPFRKQTRLDQEIVTFNGRTKQVINNYGHGGCGLTTFVGCAKDVVAMIREAGVAPRYGAKL
ncbi:D-amino-acid oxidase [Octopus bimaculoides]|uniref:FAD dependent oxidoreductase domain-containing protein n=1 Tax=Octopus bimaculoides TaxID=37653 RepID=A0A0L8H4I6_OCTBM|nr:D-amino-acid oxidase [Octopus bimaculoides]XP_014775778.1 D-amino-acid oxidase [Octopus bimaculoides]XP_014775779.1 D-amino-acid oxidase [Octopus bimaculoides]|eukprot:XP_014775777.1 PREDICTED: D-amino-acid oxidase-like isoform X1 [Octopus bimaculoides]